MRILEKATSTTCSLQLSKNSQPHTQHDRNMNLPTETSIMQPCVHNKSYCTPGLHDKNNKQRNKQTKKNVNAKYNSTCRNLLNRLHVYQFFKTGAMITKLAYHRFKTLVLYDCPV